MAWGRGPTWPFGMAKCRPFRVFRTSPGIIGLALMRSARFPLSLRRVEVLLRGFALVRSAGNAFARGKQGLPGTGPTAPGTPNGRA